MIKNNILGAVGNTPIIELTNIVRSNQLNGKLYAKLEYLNPGHSKKDRIAKYIILNAEKEGIIKSDQEVVEATSGNTGIGLAIACAVTGHPFTAFISEGNSNERVKMMKYFGAKVVLIKQTSDIPLYGQVTGDDFNLTRDRAIEYAKENNAYFVDQFNNCFNILAQRLFGEEIKNAFISSNRTLDIFCDFVGTGGGFTGCSSVFKEWDKDIKCYIVEPKNCAVLSDPLAVPNSHIIQGGGYGYKDLKLIDKSLVDGYIKISDEEAISHMKMLAKKEGIFGSISSGANLVAAIKLLKIEENFGKSVIFTICDTGLKYLSNNL